MYKIIILLALILNISLQAQSGPDAQAPALQTLIRSSIVTGVITQSPISDEITAMRAIFQMPNAEMEFVKVYRYAETNAGKLYALMGMQALQSQFFATFKTDYTRKQQGNVQVNLDGSESTRNAVLFLGEWEQAVEDNQAFTRLRE
jgi:hypothetical protein